MKRKYFKRIKKMDTLQALMQLPRRDFTRAMYDLALKNPYNFDNFVAELALPVEEEIIEKIKFLQEHNKY